ncbi:MAG TPA: hypothetical protein GX529_09705 [Firmicutes bacterium]|nr:hypothetical protein [Candidatus Fermentithermobacillaceae bacterium]
MEIFGVDVNPYELFLILILLLAATGSFDSSEDCTGTRDSSPGRAEGAPVRFLNLSSRPLTINPFGYTKRHKNG